MRVGPSRTLGALLAGAALFAVLHLYRTIQAATPQHQRQTQQHRPSPQLDLGGASIVSGGSSRTYAGSGSSRANTSNSNSSIRSADSRKGSSGSRSGKKGSSSSSSKRDSNKGSARRSRDSGSKLQAEASSAAPAGLKESASMQSRGQPNREQPSREQAQSSVYAAVCLVVKDEHSNIREWVAYHRSIGVDRIFLHDDGSQPLMQGVLADYIKEGLVVYHLLDGALGGSGQMAVYDDCLQRYKGQATWLGALDVDEFVIIMDGSPSLRAVLQRYEAYGGLVVNWRIFGSSGHTKRPKKGVLQSYTKCSRPEYQPNTHVKSFGNTVHVAGAAWSPHHLEYQPGFFAVNTNFTRVDGPLAPAPLYDVLVINHYILRSAEEFQRKLSKSSDAAFPGYTKTMEFWNRTERSCKWDCRYAVPLGARVQKELAAGTATGGAGPGAGADSTAADA